MAELKTKKHEGSVDGFLESIPDEKRREEGRAVLRMMKEVTGMEPAMWGPSMVGFGSYHYKYESGHEGDAFRIGFSPRKTALTLYIMPGFSRYDQLMEKLGKHKTGKSCLYIKKLEDVDHDVLRELMRLSLEHMREMYGSGE